MELDAVKAGLLGTHCGIGEQTRQHLRQFANMRMLHVGDPLAITEMQRFQFALLVSTPASSSSLIAAKRLRISASERPGERGAMLVGDDEKPFEEFLRIGPAADGEKIDELDQEARAPFARRRTVSTKRVRPGRKRS